MQRSLSASEYKKRHDEVGKIIHYALAAKHHLIPETEKLTYKYTPASILENANYKLYWDRSLLTDRTTAANRPDVVL